MKYKTKNNKNLKKVVLRCLITLASLTGLLIVTIGIYVGYVMFAYYRIPDNQALQTFNNQTKKINVNEKYKISTYNIGFGAYNRYFSFFMDSQVSKDGVEQVGERSRADSRAEVIINTDGAIKVLEDLNSDFNFVQEAHTDSDPNFHINQVKAIQGVFSGDESTTYAQNVHTPFLFYPVTKPIGAMNGGLMITSRYNVNSALRKSLPIADTFNKFFDLDRCLLVATLPIANSDKKLILINGHLSAYDEGGVYKKKQLKLLGDLVEKYYKQGDYVIVGGDMNNALSKQGENGWRKYNANDDGSVGSFEVSSLSENAKIVIADNEKTVASARNNGNVFDGKNHQVIIDGFIVSPNVKAEARIIDTGFQYSDHNPVQLTFTLVK